MYWTKYGILFCITYMRVSGTSLLIESTDSMIQNYMAYAASKEINNNSNKNS